MKYFFFAVVLICSTITNAQYSNNFDSWPIIAEGNWTQSGPGGTYRGAGVYVNFGNEASGLRKVGFNDSGDLLEIPPVTNPNQVTFKARLSSDAASSWIAVQYYTGTWRTAETFKISSTNYQTFQARVHYEGEQIPLRIRLNTYGRSVFFDDLSVSVFVPPVLPISLSGFEAEFRAGRGVRLRWRTISEVNNERFDLQRSRDGAAFETIARIPGAGTTNTPREYHHLDSSPYPGISYYRLRQVDYDGRTEYSDIRSVIAPESPAALRLSPTLVDREIRLQFPPSNRKRLLQVFSLNGTPVLERSLTPTTSTLSLDVSGLGDGIYLMRVEGAVKRFVKF